MQSVPARRNKNAKDTLRARACAKDPCMNCHAQRVWQIVSREISTSSARGGNNTHIVVQHLDQACVDQDSGGDRIL